MIAEIIKLILQIIADWPQRQVSSARKKWAEFRNNYDNEKNDRARRAALIASTIVRDNSKDKLQ